MDHKTYLLETRAWVKKELDACADFWLSNGFDREHGGVYTCLDREGKIFSTDKSVWMQGRCGYTYAALCARYGAREDWLAFSRSCIDFLENHCVNQKAGGRLYFTVTGDGKPLRQRRYCFSEGFYAMANAEYGRLTGQKEFIVRARRAYDLIWELNHGAPDPAGLGPKTIPETRTGRALADPMIYMNLSSVMLACDPENAALYEQRASESCADIFKYHRKEDMRCTLETVGMNGEFLSDITAGRVVNPGHDIECSWFLMERANHLKDHDLHEKAERLFLDAANAGWDKEYGGLLYFVDCLGRPPEAYEHDMKLWWPHNELCIASLMAYRDTENELYLDWFKKGVDYCKKYLDDPAFGEWYGYLRRDGQPTQPPCKGSTFKGPFHLPRMLMMLDEMIGEIVEK